MDEIKVDPNFKKGFEHGYWLQRGGGDAIDDLLKNTKKHLTYYEGLKAGKNEAVQEKIREHMERWQKNQNKEKER